MSGDRSKLPKWAQRRNARARSAARRTMSGTIDAAADARVGRVPPHEHVRDQLAAVIADAPDTLTAANRCVHVLVLLELLPETDR